MTFARETGYPINHTLQGAGIIAILLAYAFSALPAYAQTYTVTKLNLGGPNSGGWVGLKGINASGQVAGSLPTADGHEHAFFYNGTEIQDLGTLGGNESRAIAINASGQVVGWAETAEGLRHAFFYEDGEMRDLGTLGYNQSVANGINDSGQVVGGLVMNLMSD